MLFLNGFISIYVKAIYTKYKHHLTSTTTTKTGALPKNSSGKNSKIEGEISEKKETAKQSARWEWLPVNAGVKCFLFSFEGKAKRVKDEWISIWHLAFGYQVMILHQSYKYASQRSFLST